MARHTDLICLDHLKHHHPKRQEVCSNVVTDVVTNIDYITYDSEDVIVYVNDANEPVSTTTVSARFGATLLQFIQYRV